MMLTLALAVSGMLHAQSSTPARARIARRGTVHTDTLWAQSLGVRKRLTVYLPPSYATSPARRFPVLFYLHGLGGNERNWADAGALPATLDSLAQAGKPEAIVVMPDGDDGWYTTWNVLLDAGLCRADTVRQEPAATFCVPWTHYDDYIARDIVTHVDGRYRTQARRNARGIAGLSMGGYGAISLALSYPDVFGAAASHSGVVSPRFIGPHPFAEPARYAADSTQLKQFSARVWTMLAVPFGKDTVGWIARDPGRIAGRLVNRSGSRTGAARTTATRTRDVPALMLDCGVDDPYIDQNRDLHATLRRLGIAHRYAEWPGRHDWTYWRIHAAESLSFLLDRVATR